MAEKPAGLPPHGHSLREDVKTFANHAGSPSYVDIPVYLNGRDGQGNGIGRRQCTTNYKVSRTGMATSTRDTVRCGFETYLGMVEPST